MDSRTRFALGLALLIALVVGAILTAEDAGRGAAPLALDPAGAADSERAGADLATAEEAQPDIAAVTPGEARLALAGPEGVPAAEVLEGVVLDARLRVPVAGAEVRVLGAPDEVAGVLTNGEGRFRIEVLAGSGLQARAEGFAEERFPRLAELGPEPVLLLEPRATLRVVFGGPGAALPVRGGVLALWEGRSEGASGDAAEGGPLPDGVLQPKTLELHPGVWSLALLSETAPFVVVPEIRLAPGAEETVEVLLPEPATWSGRVVLKESRAPVEGAMVTVVPDHDSVRRSIEELGARTATSRGDGRLQITGLAPGELRLEVATPWGQPYQLEGLALEAGQGGEQLVIVAPPARLAGRAVDSAGEPVPGLEVAVVTTDHFEGAGLDLAETRLIRPRLVQRTETDADGRFLLDGVAANRPLLVVARREGVILARATAQVAEGETREGLELLVHARREVAVAVTDADGQPLEGARVTPRGRVRLGSRRRGSSTTIVAVPARTDAAGLATVELTEAVHDLLEVELRGYRDAEVRLPEPGETAEVVLKRRPVLEGLVLDPRGAALPNVRVEARRPGEEGRRRWGRGMTTDTDAAGEFSLRVGNDEVYEVVVSERGWRTVEPVEARVGGPLVVLRAERELPPEPGAFRGQVVLAGSGAPVPGLEVFGARGGVLHTEGSFFEVREVVPGEHTLGLRGEGVEFVRLAPVELPSNGLIDLGRLELQRTTELEVTVQGLAEGLRASVRLQPLPVEEGGSPWGQGRRLEGDRRNRARYRTEAPRYAWRLVVSADGYKRSIQRLEVRGSRQQVTVRLQPNGS